MAEISVYVVQLEGGLTFGHLYSFEPVVPGAYVHQANPSGAGKNPALRVHTAIRLRVQVPGERGWVTRADGSRKLDVPEWQDSTPLNAHQVHDLASHNHAGYRVLGSERVDGPPPPIPDGP